MKPKFLKNPRTDTYINFKNLVLSNNFPWFRLSKTISDEPEQNTDYDEFSFLSHTFLTRPQPSCLYSHANSEHVQQMQQVFREIADYNKLDPQIIYRMNANAMYPTEKNLPSPMHVDHFFPHKNMIIYLTNPHGGSTIVGEKEYLAEEDDVLIFDGVRHCVKPPSKDIRIVLVTTFS